VKTCQLKGPEYILYKDEAFTAAEKTGTVLPELYHRLIRVTLHCITSISCNPPFNRYPTTNELEEMAKSLVLEYPNLKDPDTNHVSSHTLAILQYQSLL